MKFKKYHCLENDFIITEDQILNIKQICNNHTGIGADGLIHISNHNISFFNKDGSKALMCGNGIRCAAKYINDYLDSNKTSFIFENAKYKVTHENNFYSLEMKMPKYKKINKHYLVNNVVNHLVVFSEPNISKAKKYQKKFNCNITFYHKDLATTYENGVGFTKGCGTGLISIMSILYNEYHITEKEIFSNGGYSKLKVNKDIVTLESEVFYIYEGEITC